MANDSTAAPDGAVPANSGASTDPGPSIEAGTAAELNIELDAGKVAAARLWATNQFPYLASAIFATPTLPAPGLGTMVIDRWWRIHADPEMIATATPDQIGGELLHLASHVLRDHASRADELRFSEEAEVHHWVDAADAEIADDFPPQLSRLGDPVEAKDLACADGRLAEEYYRSGLVREGETNDCGSGAHGDSPSWEPPPPNPDSDQGLGQDEQDLVRRNVAAEIAKADADAVSDGLRRWAADLLQPTIDWRAELAAALRREISSVAGAVDYTYRRPSRRSTATAGVILPALQRPTIEVAVVCDTSASVSDELLGAAMSEVDGLLRATGTRSVRLLACDDAVRTVSRVTNGRNVDLLGGGGTDMAIGIDAAMEQRPQPQLIVVLTDGYTPWPDVAPRAAVVVGLLTESEGSAGHVPGMSPIAAPSWAKTIPIGQT
ncbi:MAG: vWA domain-containing protein [Acidimicrobiales bacterium]